MGQKTDNLETIFTQQLKHIRIDSISRHYTVFQNRKTHVDALAACRKIEKQLVSFQNVSQWKEVVNSLDLTCPTDSGIWTSGIKSQNSWIWNEGNEEIDDQL